MKIDEILLFTEAVFHFCTFLSIVSHA